MKIKFIKNIWVIFITNLLVGCASQLTNGNAIAHAQETHSSETQIQSPSTLSSKSGDFVSAQQEYMHNILVAEIARLRGNYHLAAKYFFEIANHFRDLGFVELATRTALSAQEYDIATKAASLWITLAPNNLYAYQLLGKILLHQKHTEAMVAHLETMIDNFKDEPQQLATLMGVMLEQQKDQNFALDIMKKLATKRPNEPIILLTYSRLLGHANQIEQALEVLRTLLDRVPNHVEGVPLYAYLLNQQNKQVLALQWMKEALYKYPDKQEWRLIYARMLADAEQFKESIRQFKQLLPQSEQSDDILYALGILSLQIKQPSTAKKYFKVLLKRGERANIARYYLGQIAQEEKDLQKALFWYHKVEDGSNYLNAQARIALILVELGKLEQAIEHLRSVPLSSQEDALTLMQLEAELLVEQKRYPQALEIYERLIKLKPDNIDILYMRAMLYEKMGNINQLERDLRHILELEPKNADALNALGYTLTEHTGRHQEAYKLIKQALILSPTDYYILDSMGWVLYKMGKYAEAIVYLREALLKKNDPEIAAHLGEVLWTKGDRQTAQKVWEKAQSNFPNDEMLHKVMRRFLPLKGNE